ncbi:MAG TPA: pseudaminic acid cytidylyltransferase [Mucilaginibacter sp.]|jgi:N-acylneuraminate cytidylyltransferase
MNLAVIPARGGSKRIPKKNIKPFLGKPIVNYAIDLAKSSKLFDEIIVSTDDDEINKIIIQQGVKNPFKRSAETSGDFATLSDVLLEILNEYKKLNISIDNVCVILPTSPLITTEILNTAHEKFISGDFSAVIPLVKYNHPIQRALKITGDNGNVVMIDPENQTKRTQDCDEAFYDSGQFYWLKASDFLIEKKILMKNAGSIELNPDHCHDIDNPEDWKIAEMKYRWLNPLR